MEYTAFENYPLQILGIDESYKAKTILVGLGFSVDDLNRNPGEFSGGYQVRLNLAKVLVSEPNLLLLDEPTSDLDIRYQIEVMEIIRRLVKETNMSAIVAIHDLNLASRYCDRIVMLHDGIISSAGVPREVFTAENIARVYGVDALVREDEGTLHIIPKRPI